MKYRTFQSKQQAENASKRVYANAIRQRGVEFNGLLEDWEDQRRKIAIDNIPDELITGNRFKLYGKNAATLEWNTEEGHTTAWAIPVQITDGRWVFPSPDDEGEEAQPNWW